MRKSQLTRVGIGLAMLAVMGPQAQAQEAKREVRPSEHLSLKPVTFQWSDLVQLQASLPLHTAAVDPSTFVTLEPPILEVSVKGTHALPREATPGVENLGPCTGFSSEPPIDGDFDSQLDVADGAGFSFIPPDLGGGVGPRHVMTMLNNQVLVQSRIGGSPAALDTSVFWLPLGTTPLSPTTTYPRVYFDTHLGRWLASIRNGVGSLGTTTIFFAISHTDDPTGLWDYYSFPGDPAFASQADWLVLGYNGTWITITANMFNLAGSSFLGSKMWTIDATSIPPGGPIFVSIFPTGYMTTAHGSGGSSVHPARTLDGDPTLWMVNDGFTGGTPSTFLLQLTRITGTGPAPVVSGLLGSPFAGTTSFCFTGTAFSSTQRTMAQVSEARFITSFSVRIASVAVRGGKIWVANSGGQPGPVGNTSPTSNGVVWNQIDPTLPFPPTPGAPGFMVLQSGAITNGTSTMSSYPSLAVNCAEDVLIGFANGDATISPRACYTFRLGTDALGFMGPIGELKAGESTYWKNFGVGTTAQYGRYTSTAVDPNDDKSLWTLQEFADTRVGVLDNDSRWGTRWGRFGDCKELPDVTDDPDDVVACVGDAVPFMVVVSSASPFTYQWRKDGVDILGETTDTYSIGSAVGGDAGNYDCVICGCGQTTSAPANLSFAGAVVVTQPLSQFVAVGDPATFFVAATGSGTLSYQWYHGATPVGTDSDTYSIAAVTPADYGNYHVDVTDDCGPVSSDVVQLKTEKKNKYFQQGDLDLHIFQSPASALGCEGDPLALNVVAYPATATYQWRKNTVAISGETNSTLVIPSFTATDAGNYDVEVSLGLQTKTSSIAVVSAGDNPVITVQPGPVSQNTSPGSTITFSVTATGAGGLTYQWQKKPVTPFAPFVNIPFATSDTLLLEDITTFDAGTYRCIISNPCGNTRTRNCQIIVL